MKKKIIILCLLAHVVFIQANITREHIAYALDCYAVKNKPVGNDTYGIPRLRGTILESDLLRLRSNLDKIASYIDGKNMSYQENIAQYIVLLKKDGPVSQKEACAARELVAIFKSIALR